MGQFFAYATVITVKGE
ncbi:membrane protein YoeI [Escherichia coli]|nr:membrane protein YoeI [Escherichia coli]